MTNKKALRILNHYVKRWTSGGLTQSFDSQSKYDSELFNAFQAARQALEKTIPRQPIWERDCTGFVMRCPACRMRVYDSAATTDYNRRYHNDFCLCCGQRFTKPLDTLSSWAEE